MRPRPFPVRSLVLPLAAACALASCGEDRSPGAGAARVPSPAMGTFTDVAAEAGIAVRHALPGPELRNIVEATGAGAVFEDLDGDGWIDLLVLGGPRSPVPGSEPPAGIRLYRNLRNGRFEDATARSGIPKHATAVAAAAGDVDGDGDRDLYLIDRGPNRLLLNLGEGRFADVTKKAGVGDARFGIGAAFFDMDKDGDLDIYLSNYLEHDPAQKAYYRPEGFPGPLSFKAQPDVMYRNRGDGTFEDVSKKAGVGGLLGRGMSVAAFDADEDGDTDVFVANDVTENFLLINDGGGGFKESAGPAGVAMADHRERTSAMAGDVADLDGDGLLDLAVSDTAYGTFYRAGGKGAFRDDAMMSGIAVLSAQYVSWGQNLLDFDNDGDVDIFTANGGMHHLVGWEDLLMRNDGRGRFTSAAKEAGPYFSSKRVGRASVTGDFDNDGDMDVFVTTLEGRHVLLRNDHPGKGSWITLDLVGRRVRDPFGAKVRVTADGRTQVAELRCRSNYLGQGDSRLHFGLGAAERVDRIEVRWHGGGVRTLTNVPARRILRIAEEEKAS